MARHQTLSEQFNDDTQTRLGLHQSPEASENPLHKNRQGATASKSARCTEEPWKGYRDPETHKCAELPVAECM
jgi:hypothetical protein